MGSRKIAAAVLVMAFVTGCTMRTSAPVGATAYDFSVRDAYGESFAASPSYAGQDTAWTTTAPARASGAPRAVASSTEAAGSLNAKTVDDGYAGKTSVDVPIGGAPAPRTPAPPRASRPASIPAQVGQSPARSSVGDAGR